jgi:hypothetical protein
MKIALIVMALGVALVRTSPYIPSAPWAENRFHTRASELTMEREDREANWRSLELTPLLYRALAGR